MKFTLTSPSFNDGSRMPPQHTCRGENSSPPLSWQSPPTKTEGFCLIAEDVDTPFGVLTHWVLYNIPFARTSLKEGIAAGRALPDGTQQGRNGVGRRCYMGPCPPWGEHRYVFRIYALDTVLDPRLKLNKRRLLKAIEGHILGTADLTGLYSRGKEQ